jgi:hypothetical protein
MVRHRQSASAKLVTVQARLLPSVTQSSTGGSSSPMHYLDTAQNDVTSQAIRTTASVGCHPSNGPHEAAPGKGSTDDDLLSRNDWQDTRRRRYTIDCWRGFVSFGVGKFTDHSSEVMSFVHYGVPLAGVSVWIVGLVETIGGLMLVAGHTHACGCRRPRWRHDRRNRQRRTGRWRMAQPDSGSTPARGDARGSLDWPRCAVV